VIPDKLFMSFVETDCWIKNESTVDHGPRQTRVAKEKSPWPSHGQTLEDRPQHVGRPDALKQSGVVIIHLGHTEVGGSNADVDAEPGGHETKAELVVAVLEVNAETVRLGGDTTARIKSGMAHVDLTNAADGRKSRVRSSAMEEVRRPSIDDEALHTILFADPEKADERLDHSTETDQADSVEPRDQGKQHGRVGTEAFIHVTGGRGQIIERWQLILGTHDPARRIGNEGQSVGTDKVLDVLRTSLTLENLQPVEVDRLDGTMFAWHV
jgi:hypothetical protein